MTRGRACTSEYPASSSVSTDTPASAKRSLRPRPADGSSGDMLHSAETIRVRKPGSSYSSGKHDTTRCQQPAARHRPCYGWTMARYMAGWLAGWLAGRRTPSAPSYLALRGPPPAPPLLPRPRQAAAAARPRRTRLREGTHPCTARNGHHRHLSPTQPAPPSQPHPASQPAEEAPARPPALPLTCVLSCPSGSRPWRRRWPPCARAGPCPRSCRTGSRACRTATSSTTTWISQSVSQSDAGAGREGGREGVAAAREEREETPATARVVMHACASLHLAASCRGSGARPGSRRWRGCRPAWFHAHGAAAATRQAPCGSQR